MDKAAVDPRSLRGSRPWIGFFGQRPPRARVAGVPHPERPLAPSQAIHCQPRCLGWGQTPPQTLPGLVPAQVNWRQQRLQPFRLARGRLLDVETKINSALMDGSQSAWCNFKHRLLGLAPELPLQVRAAVVPRQQQAGADAECSRDAASTINDRLDDVQVPSFAPEAGAPWHDPLPDEDPDPDDPSSVCDVPPNVALWNVCGFTYTALDRILERSGRDDVKIWLLQEWKHPRSPHMTLDFVKAPGRKVYWAPRTAVIVNDADWELVGLPEHTEFATSVVVRHRSRGSKWRFLNLYLPPSAVARTELLTSSSRVTELLLDRHQDLKERTIVMGDFNMQEVAIDNYNEDTALREANRWPDICSLLDPLAPIFRLLHPSARVYSFLRLRAGGPPASQVLGHVADADSIASSAVQVNAATRIDHCFLDPALLPLVQRIFYRFEPSVSDHCMLVLVFQPKSHSDESKGVSWWTLPRETTRLASDVGVLAEITSHVPSSADSRSWKDFLDSIKWQINCFATHTKSTSGYSSTLEVSLITAHRELENRELTKETAATFVKELVTYEKKRHALCPIERLDFFSVHPDIIIWPRRAKKSAAASLAIDDVSSFYQKLYQQPEFDETALWCRKAVKLLSWSRVHLNQSQADRLQQPFTEEELRAALGSSSPSSTPGPNGLRHDVLRAASPAFVRFACQVLDSLRLPGDSLHATAKGILLYKDKPGNSRTAIEDYRPLSILDSELRWFHTVLAVRLRQVLGEAIPGTQNGFLPGRRASDNALAMFIYIEASNHGLLNGPGVVLCQDQKKAYDMVSRSWIEVALECAGFPAAFISIWRRLTGESSIVFTLQDCFSPPIMVHRGLPQGAASSSLLFLVAYQPLLDALEEARTGVTASFGSGGSHRVSSLSYADNSDFLLGSASDLRAFTRMRTLYDEVSGSQLNERETAYFVLHNRETTLPGWVDDLGFRRLDDDHEWKYLGRLIRPDGKPPAKAVESLVSSIQACVSLTRRQTSYFTTATILRSVGYARAWHLFEGPIDSSEVERQARDAIKPFFSDGRGLPFSAELIHHPKHLGGIGLVEFVHDINARAMANIVHALCSPDERQRHRTGAFLEWCVSQHTIGGICGWLQGPVLHLPRGADNQTTFSRRCVHLLALFDLSLTDEPDWQSLDPVEAAALPLLHPSYSFFPTGRGRATLLLNLAILAELGIVSFASLIWFDDRRASPSAACFFARTGAKVPHFDEFLP